MCAYVSIAMLQVIKIKKKTFASNRAMNFISLRALNPLQVQKN